MCGICGKLNFDGSPVETRLIESMTSVLQHRGPDDYGVFLKDNIGLGHRRLSIIDLSERGKQPMPNEDESIWVVFNGEVYNFPDLRKVLVSKGHQFRSNTDTETLIHLYEEYDINCLHYLRGMYAFAIWDDRRKRLFLARDRVGKKPLYYYKDDKRFIFASEIKAILKDRQIERQPDILAIHHYLTYQFVPSPFTAFKGIKKLPPAHYLLIQDGKVVVKDYWNITYNHKINEPKNVIIDDLKEKLKEAVKIRLISDVPLGAFLSGGIDSSVIVFLMSRLMREPVKTFSVGFEDDQYNELPYARTIADKYGTDHREFILRPNAVEVLPKIVWHYNEPFADASAIPIYYISKVAKEYIKVVLNGDGGDELFAGYDRYLISSIANRLEVIFRPFLAKVMFRLIRKIPQGIGRYNLIWILKRFLQGYETPPEIRHSTWLCSFDNETKNRLYTDEFLHETKENNSLDLLRALFNNAEANSFLEKMLYSDFKMYLPDDLLTKVDVASMANSIEVRSPFLDHEFVEFMASVPAEFKLKGFSLKYLLKEAFRSELPDAILYRKKMGFAVPLDRWFRGELKDFMRDILLSHRALQRGYFRRDFIENMIKEHLENRWNWQYQIYNLLMLELWHREFIDK